MIKLPFPAREPRSRGPMVHDIPVVLIPAIFPATQQVQKARLQRQSHRARRRRCAAVVFGEPRRAIGRVEEVLVADFGGGLGGGRGAGGVEERDAGGSAELA